MLLESFHRGIRRLSVKLKAFMYFWMCWLPPKSIVLLDIFLKSFPVQPGELKDKLFIVNEEDGGLSDEHITSLRRYEPVPEKKADLYSFLKVSQARLRGEWLCEPQSVGVSGSHAADSSLVLLWTKSGQRKHNWFTWRRPSLIAEARTFYQSGLLIKVLSLVICGNGNYWHALRNMRLKAGKTLPDSYLQFTGRL